MTLAILSPMWTSRSTTSSGRGSPKCSINTTRRGDGLAADIRRVDCQLVLADVEHMPLLDGLDLGGTTVLDVGGGAYREAVAAAKPLVPHREVNGADPSFDDLHIGHQRRSEGRPIRPRDGGDVRHQPGRQVRTHLRRCVLPVDATVPLQRGGGRLGGGDRVRRHHGGPRSSRRRGSCRTSAGIAPST